MSILPVYVDFNRRVGKVFYLVDQDTVLRSSYISEFRAEMDKVAESRLYCYDMRTVLDFNMMFYDVQAIARSNDSLRALTKKMLGKEDAERLAEIDDVVKAHTKACKTAKLKHVVLPDNVLNELELQRLTMIRKIAGRFNDVGEYEIDFPFLLTLHTMELNGIFVDMDFVREQLRGSPRQQDLSCFNSMVNLQKNGFVTSLVSPFGSKTGRLKSIGGFASMSIPHGPCRDAIVSRHEGGSIFSFDFNAIDYRCIINHIGGELAAMYAGSQDFHMKTTEIVFGKEVPDLRTDVKFISYVHIYGGSDSALNKNCSLEPSQIKTILEKMDTKMPQIKSFREKLWKDYQKFGKITLPTGQILESGEATHEGQLLGLFAQSYSALVFNSALVGVQSIMVGTKSQIIFTVHDEVNVDMHPEDKKNGLADQIKLQMTDLGRHVVKMREGRTYGEATA